MLPLKAYCCFLLLVAAVSARSQIDFDHEEAEERAAAVVGTPSARLLAVQRTVTKTAIVTSTVTVTTQSLCASLLNVTGACRRRRRGAEMDKPIVLSFDDEEDINLYKPSEVQKIEPTAEAHLASMYSRAGELESSSYTDDAVELDIIGLNSNCLPAAGALPRFGFQNLLSMFNVTLQYTTTVTASLVLTTTTTSGNKPFFVSGCTPSPFAYKTC